MSSAIHKSGLRLEFVFNVYKSDGKIWYPVSTAKARKISIKAVPFRPEEANISIAGNFV